MSDDAMTKGERDELAKLVRRREKLAKGDVDRFAAEHLALIEREFATSYLINDDGVWQAAWDAANKAAAEANRLVVERCRELGIRPEFAPEISPPYWHRRGENAAKDRVAELRKVAKSRLDAASRTAKVEIERASVAVQERLAVSGLKSAEAQAFLGTIPTPEALMPKLTLAELEEA